MTAAVTPGAHTLRIIADGLGGEDVHTIELDGVPLEGVRSITLTMGEADLTSATIVLDVIPDVDVPVDVPAAPATPAGAATGPAAASFTTVGPVPVVAEHVGTLTVDTVPDGVAVREADPVIAVSAQMLAQLRAGALPHVTYDPDTYTFAVNGTTGTVAYRIRAAAGDGTYADRIDGGP